MPSTIKLKELITSGRLGKVQSSEFRAAGWTNDRGSLSLGLDYFGDRKVGGNLITIGFGHSKLFLSLRVFLQWYRG